MPHTDENPNNKDLGNCLDYTSTPENNLHPGEVNFERLRSIYLAGEGGALDDSKNRLLEEDDSLQVVYETTDDGKYPRRIVIQHRLLA